MAHIIVILDKSGSMERNSQRVIDGFNEFLQTQKRIVDDTTFTLTTFSDTLQTVFHNIPVADVVPLTPAGYTTDGMTALHDAIGSALTTYAGNPRTLVVIITDGEENSSSDYTSESVERLVQTRTTEGWKFIYLCTDLRTARAGSALGLSSAARGSRNPSTQNLVADAGNFHNVLSRQISAAASAYRNTNDITSIDELNSGVSQLDIGDTPIGDTPIGDTPIGDTPICVPPKLRRR
jgi:hypothetical protein